MLISAWPLVVRRSLAHWRLLSSVVVGVLLASTILAGTVIYFDSLRELALKNALDELTVDETNILVKADRGPTSQPEYLKVSRSMDREINARVAWLLRDRVRGGKSATFFFAMPGDEANAGEDNRRTYFSFLEGLSERTTLLPGGEMPREEALNAPGEPLILEAIIPLEAAELFELEVGDTLSAVPYWADVLPYARIVVSGIFSKNDPDDEYWHLDDGVLRAATSRNFLAVPAFISEKTFMDVLGSAFRDLDSTYGWLLAVDTGRLNAGNSTTARFNMQRMSIRLRSELFGFRQITSLPKALGEFDRRLFFSKPAMFIILILIAVVILYYVVTLSSLLVDHQRAEIALLRSRGASSFQVLSASVLEGATISIIAVAVAPVLAAVAINLLGYTPAFSGLGVSGGLPVSLSGGAYVMSAIGGVLSFVALMIPAVEASRISVTRHRQEAARPASQPFFQRYYLDILLLLVSIFLFRQLSEQGSVVAVGLFGDVAVSQLLLAVPALILVAAAMVLLRLFPIVMSLASRMFSPVLPVGLVMGLWQMSRNPTHYARLTLLLILMAGLGIFAASFGGTLERNFEERALYSTGADLRVSGVTLNSRGPSRPVVQSYEGIAGIKEVSPAFRGMGSDRTKLLGMSYSVLVVDTEALGDIAWFRDDFSQRSLDELLASLTGTELPTGLELPLDARTLRITLKADRPHPGVVVTARIKDANDRYINYFLGNLRSSSWLQMEASLFGNRRRLQPAFPITLIALSLHETFAGNKLRAGSVSIAEISVGTTNNAVRVIEPFDDTSRWSILRTAPESISDVLIKSNDVFDGDVGVARFTWAEGNPLPGRGIFPDTPILPLPVLATKAFLEDTGHGLGDEFLASIDGHPMPLMAVDTIKYFPTLDTINERYMIADLASVSAHANLEAMKGEFKPNEIWMLTDADGTDREELIASLSENGPFSSRKVHDREASLAASQVDPLVEAGWRALLFIAFSAVLILSGLGFLVHAYVSFRSREVQFALMRTIGFSMKQMITLVWLEQILVIGAGLALGTWMGGQIGAIIMPFLGHDDRGGQVLPPYIIDVNWGTLAITYAAMAVLFALIITGVIWFIHKISLQRLLRLGEV